MTYDDAMIELLDAAYKACRLAASHDGAPEAALREIAAEIDCLIDTRMTRAEMAMAKAGAAAQKAAREAYRFDDEPASAYDAEAWRYGE